ncbi:MAG: lysine--tRNA ligase [Candidatus Paceibacterota bacterium]
MSSLEEIREERLKKKKVLEGAGVNPYPAECSRTHEISDIINHMADLLESQAVVRLTGRVMALRRHGGSAFIDLFDGTTRLQCFISRDKIGEDSYKLFIDSVDIGDFIECVGSMITTRRETYALSLTEWKMLTKSLQAIPSEHFGLKDDDERYRKRHLDLLLNDELRDLFIKKARFWQTIRNFMIEHGFLEVETPYLEVTTGGAEARPFMTYHNDYDMDVYLRISIGELWQKRLMAAGYPKTFEIGRAFRNEGTSPEHLQEFTNLEFYWAYANYRDGMKLVRELYQKIGLEVFGTTKFSAHGHEFDLANEWVEIDYAEEVERQTGVDIFVASEEEIKSKLAELNVKYDGDTRERLIDTLWKYCRKSITGPAFLINHPITVAPLAKARADGKTVEMFQPIIAGSEVGRGYSELNDPIDQKQRFEIQQQLIERGDDEAMMPDWEFVEMLEHGMPPTCGFGFGERLFAFLAGKPIRETQLFPLMKPREKDVSERGAEVSGE